MNTMASLNPLPYYRSCGNYSSIGSTGWWGPPQTAVTCSSFSTRRVFSSPYSCTRSGNASTVTDPPVTPLLSLPFHDLWHTRVSILWVELNRYPDLLRIASTKKACHSLEESKPLKKNSWRFNNNNSNNQWKEGSWGRRQHGPEHPQNSHILLEHSHILHTKLKAIHIPTPTTLLCQGKC